jgi:hypothetical protein
MKNLIRTFLLLAAVNFAAVANAQVPKLSSHPSATATVFLDFDGHTVTGGGWTDPEFPIVCAPSGLNNTQLTTVFNRVAEDFRPFNINITTDSTVYLAAPLNRRMRVILTITYEWFGAAGGVAFPNTFTNYDDNTCFVFTGPGTLSYNVKNIAEAASHETGHTLGLLHQAAYDGNCVKQSDYNGGTGAGEIGWAPIMGVGYYQNMTVWHNGPKPSGCTAYQDDLSIITTNNGFGYRTDDHQSSFANATTASFVNNQFTINGVVEQNTDLDMIRFVQPVGGRFKLDAIPYNVGTGNAGSDLDLQVTLYNSAQTLLNVYNPSNVLSSVIDTTLNAGTYYIRVEGRGNMYAPNYASLGSYSLQGQSGAGGTLPLRVLKLSGLQNADGHKFNWIIDADEQVTKLILESSQDGINYRPVTQTANEARTFNYKPAATGTIYYRLNVSFDDGKQYYSNVVSLRSNNGNKPQVLSNILNTNTITVSSAGTFDYAIYDLSGKTTAKGQLTNGINIINTGSITNGIYMIRFTNGNDQWVEKLVRQ